MRPRGEIEAAICEGVSRFGQDYMGRGPKDIHTHLLGDLVVIRLHGVLDDLRYLGGCYPDRRFRSLGGILGEYGAVGECQPGQ
jgi:hypothetical protein